MKDRHKLIAALALFYLCGAYPGPIGVVTGLIGSFFAWEIFAKLY
jgi:hypothetical protein